MWAALGVLVALVLLLVLVVTWRIIATLRGGKRVFDELSREIAPVTDALAAGEEPSREDLDRFAAKPSTRKLLFETLAREDRLELFPQEYRTWEALAEGDLVYWLLHPNELGAAPDYMELMATVPAPPPDASLTYFVFRFRMQPPHWAAQDGHMAGIAGPYDTSGDPAPHASGTFSRFEAYDSRTANEHVKVIHEALSPKGTSA